MPMSESLARSLDDPIGGTGLDARTATVAALAAALASPGLTSAGLTAYYLDRIERLTPGLRAVIAVRPRALAEAAASDARRAQGASRGPLDGIPVLLKDNLSVTGQPGTAGSPALARAAGDESFCLGGLRAAGAVILGKANLSEWANFRSRFSSSGCSTLGGQAVNPHGTGRNPSGSSSGSAVAVAAGLAPLAIGTETDGSIVSPANSCGIVGLKPTLGLVSRSGIVPISSAEDTPGPMTRCVADAAPLLSAMAGQDRADPPTADTPPGPDSPQPADYTSYLDPQALAGARIGIWRDGSAEAVPAALAVLEAAVRLLSELGAVIVDPVSLPGADAIGKPEFAALAMEFKDDLNAYLAGLGGEHPGSLGELIDFNISSKKTVLVKFGQEIFVQAESTGGRSDPNWRLSRDEARTLARGGLDETLTQHRLDAIVALTGNPAWLTDYVLGDHHSVGTF